MSEKDKKSKQIGEDALLIPSLEGLEGESLKGYNKKIKKAKQMVLSPLRKVKKLGRKLPSSSSETTGKGCYLCFMQPNSSNSPTGSHPIEPINQEFSFDYLKALVEKNDFYAKDCNVHLGV